MGFLTILRKMKQKEKEMRILILGLDNAGKTTLLKQLNGENVSTISPTLGFNIKSLFIEGQRSLRSYWKNYFECTDGVVWVVDSGDKLRLMDCCNELHNLLVEERLMGASLLVLANKQDLPGAMSLHEIKEILQLDEIKTHHWQIVKCSALTGENVLLGVNWIVEDIASRIFTME